MPNRRKSNITHQQDGTYRKDRHGDLDKNPDTYGLDKFPSPPKSFNRFGKNEYKRLVSEMKKMDLVEMIDISTIEMASMWYGVFRSLSEDLSHLPNLFDYFNKKSAQNNNVLTTMNTAYKNYTDIVYKMGVSPVERSRIQIDKKKVVNEDNPFDVVSKEA